PAVCKRSYVDPAVLRAYVKGNVMKITASKATSAPGRLPAGRQGLTQNEEDFNRFLEEIESDKKSLEKALQGKRKERYEAESEKIKENQKTPEARKRHKFRSAEWTHPNGHPRCLLCGDEPRVPRKGEKPDKNGNGMCDGHERDQDKWDRTVEEEEIPATTTEKALRIKGEPGLILKPSKEDPQVRRWQREKGLVVRERTGRYRVKQGENRENGNFAYEWGGKVTKGKYGQVEEIPIGLIERNPEQPRKTFPEEKLKELATSIREKGLKTPIKLRPHPEEVGKFMIVAGERRTRAHQMLKRETIRAIVEPMSGAEAIEESLLENITREDLNPIEEGAAYQALFDRGWSQDRISEVTGKPRATIWTYSTLTRLVPEAKTLVIGKNMGIAMAIKIASLEDPDLQRVALKKAKTGELTTEEFSLYISALKAEKDILPMFGGELEKWKKLPEGVTKQRAKSIVNRFNGLLGDVAKLIRRAIRSDDLKVYARVLEGDLNKKLSEIEVVERSVKKIKQALILERERRGGYMRAP
ncbi:ParB/RepB/Spo0J family partition protein, partial [candidate division TA06 bacterium]|nr:ParB/RepB/Spo0J family partition protein [candidate division TA06 bacterium]